MTRACCPQRCNIASLYDCVFPTNDTTLTEEIDGLLCPPATRQVASVLGTCLGFVYFEEILEP